VYLCVIYLILRFRSVCICMYPYKTLVIADPEIAGFNLYMCVYVYV